MGSPSSFPYQRPSNFSVRLPTPLSFKTEPLQVNCDRPDEPFPASELSQLLRNHRLLLATFRIIEKHGEELKTLELSDSMCPPSCPFSTQCSVRRCRFHQGQGVSL